MLQYHDICGRNNLRREHRMEKQFDAESKELIVLTETGAGAGKGWNEKLWTASVNILASVDPSAGVLNKETTVLEWPLTDEERRTEEKKI